jgi:aminopeptidase N
MLPSEAYLAEQMAESNPAAVHAARQFVRKRLANALRKDWLALYDKHRTPEASGVAS